MRIYCYKGDVNGKYVRLTQKEAVNLSFIPPNMGNIIINTVKEVCTSSIKTSVIIFTQGVFSISLQSDKCQLAHLFSYLQLMKEPKHIKITLDKMVNKIKEFNNGNK